MNDELPAVPVRTAARRARLLPFLTRGATFVATLAAAGATFAQTTPPAGVAEVKPSEGDATAETFTVQFQDTDVLQALQMLAMQGRRNIVPSRGVSGTISANLYDVTLAEALEVILRANAYRLEESGNFIYVYTREEWEDLERSRRTRASRKFPLEYLNARDASEFIAPLLSEVGKVSFAGDVDKGFQPSANDGGSDSWAFQGMLVVSDYADNLAGIEKLLGEIDTPPAQVVVESTVVSSKVQQNDGFGVDVSVIGKLDFADLTNPLSGANDLFRGSDGGIQPANNQGGAINSAVAGWDRQSTLRVGVVADDVSVFLRMLDSVTYTTVLARPKVMALNRQRAQILIGRRVGYLTSTTTQTATTQTVEFLDAGIKLIFRPFISSDGSIRMELAPSVSDAKVETLTDSQGATLSVPNEDTSEIVTNVRVKDGQTLVLGGLFKEDTRIERRQVPGLGDVPIIGNAFKGYDDELKREEIIFLITPTIVKDSIAKVWADEASEFADAVQIGSREGLLPWSRDSLTQSQNQQALDALAKGDKALALHHAENSLRLSHNQPEMIRLREELKGSASTAHSNYERSMMRRMMGESSGAGGSASRKAADAALADASGGTASQGAANAVANGALDLGAGDASTGGGAIATANAPIDLGGTAVTRSGSDLGNPMGRLLSSWRMWLGGLGGDSGGAWQSTEESRSAIAGVSDDGAE